MFNKRVDIVEWLLVAFLLLSLTVGYFIDRSGSQAIHWWIAQPELSIETMDGRFWVALDGSRRLHFKVNNRDYQELAIPQQWGIVTNIRLLTDDQASVIVALDCGDQETGYVRFPNSGKAAGECRDGPPPKVSCQFSTHSITASP